MAYEILTYTTPITSFKYAAGKTKTNTEVPVGKTNGSSGYAQVTVNPTTYSSNYLEYAFDCSSIPKNASIAAITCYVSYGTSFASGEEQYYTVTADLSVGGGYPTVDSKESSSSTYLVGKCYRSNIDDVRVTVSVKCKEKRTYNPILYLYYATLKVEYVLTDELSDVVLEEMNIHAIKGSSIATAHGWDACVYVQGGWRYVREAYVYHNGAWRSTASYEPKDVLYSWAKYGLQYDSVLDITWGTSTTTITMDSRKQEGSQRIYFCGEGLLYLSDGNITSDGRYQQEVYEFNSSYTDTGVDGSGLILIKEGGNSTSYYKVMSYTRDYTDDTVTFVCVSPESWTYSSGYSKGNFQETVFSENPTAYPDSGHNYSSYYEKILLKHSYV